MLITQATCNSSDNECHPGGGNTIQLSIEHGKYLCGLPAYLSYGGGRSSMYHCPCSGTTKNWRKGINMDKWEQDERAQCRGNFRGPGPLLNHCRGMNKVYHLGFSEYAQILTGETQQPPTRTGHGVASATAGANTHPGQPSPHAAWVNDARTRHK